MKNIRISILPAIFCMLFIGFFFSCNRQDHTREPKLISTKFPDGTIKEAGATIDGKKEGMWLEYYNGHISAQRCYVDDSLSGESIDYNENGEIFIRQTFKNGQEDGNYILYSDFKKGKIGEQGNYKNGHKIGVWEYYLEDGRLNKKIEYNGKNEKVIMDNHLLPPTPDKMKPYPIDSNNRAFVTDSNGKEIRH